MNVSVYEISIQQFILTLVNLKNILYKSELHAKAKNFDHQVLMNTRLFPDMFPLSKQIQTACDAAKFCAARLTDVKAPVFEDKEVTIENFIARIDNTIEYLKTISEEDFNHYAEKKIKFPWNPGQELAGKDYLIQFALPNFFFHITTAYNLLRSCGVEIGKADYLGKINWQTES